MSNEPLSLTERIACAAMDFVGAVIVLIVFPMGADMLLGGLLGAGQ